MRLKPPGWDCYPHKNRKRNQSARSLCRRTNCHLHARKTAPTGESICWHLDLGLPSLQTVRNKFLLSEPPSLWYFFYVSLSQPRHRPCLLPHSEERQSAHHKVYKACMTHPISPLTLFQIFHSFLHTLSCCHTGFLAAHWKCQACSHPRAFAHAVPTAQKAFPSNTLLPHFFISIQVSPSSPKPPLAKWWKLSAAPFGLILFSALFTSPWCIRPSNSLHVFVWLAGFILATLGVRSSTRASLAVAHQLSCPTVCIWDLNSPTRNWNCIPCIGRQFFFLFQR